ncbi:DUF664 domain-containing protein [Deinococcus cavernae]|uniref:mycothiol transferase n=1 Tax=Deinococcus cavernae TaxID=2320857 RepID=UPI001314C28A|nr:DUF664 domain-containing protein [Deinococcus cavernae]
MQMNVFLGDREGFTPQISRLIGMMDYARFTTLQMVQGMSTEELDLVPEPYGNSVGMLLEHFVALERLYQHISLRHPKPAEALGERWMPGLGLGERGREHIRGHRLSYYLRNLEEARAETLELFRARDDAWLEEPLPFWGQTGNRSFMWFHVLEDEINHRGQIRMLRQHMPRLKGRGMMGAQFAAVTPDGLGIQCVHVWDDSPAQQAGLQRGDTVLEYDGQDVTQTPYMEVPLERPAGVKSRFRVKRDGTILEFEVERVRPG